MYVDESVVNEMSVDRKYGWSSKGQSVHIITSARHSAKWSILSVYIYDRFIAWDIIQGSYNGQMFVDFLRDKVLPLITPYPGPRSVLIMDNAKIHHHPVLSSF